MSGVICQCRATIIITHIRGLIGRSDLAVIFCRLWARLRAACQNWSFQSLRAPWLAIQFTFRIQGVKFRIQGLGLIGFRV